jgi:hypothetical protein
VISSIGSRCSANRAISECVCSLTVALLASPSGWEGTYLPYLVLHGHAAHPTWSGPSSRAAFMASAFFQHFFLRIPSTFLVPIDRNTATSRAYQSSPALFPRYHRLLYRCRKDLGGEVPTGKSQHVLDIEVVIQTIMHLSLSIHPYIHPAKCYTASVTLQTLLYTALVQTPNYIVTLFVLAHLDLEYIFPTPQLQHLDNRRKVVVRHNRGFGPYLGVVRLGVPVDLEFLNRFLVFGGGGFVFPHDCCKWVSMHHGDSIVGEGLDWVRLWEGRRRRRKAHIQRSLATRLLCL